MKRMISAFFVVVFCLGFAGCAPKMPAEPPIEMVDAEFDGLTFQVPKAWEDAESESGGIAYVTEDGANIFFNSFAGYESSNKREEVNTLVDGLLKKDSDEVLERTELEIDGNPAVRLVLKDGDTKMLHLYLAAAQTSYMVQLYVPEENFDRHVAAYDATIQSIKVDPEFRKVVLDGTLRVTLNEFVAGLDSAYTSQGFEPLSEKRLDISENIVDGVAAKDYDIFLSGADVMMRLEVEQKSQKLLLVFLNTSNDLYSGEAIFYDAFTTGYLYDFFSDDTLDASAIEEKLEVSDAFNTVRTENAEYSRVVKDGETLLLVEGLSE